MIVPGLVGNRLRLLATFVKEAKGGTDVILNLAGFQKLVGLKDDEMREARSFLLDRKLIEWHGTQRVCLTRYGVDAIEALEHEEAKVTEPKRDPKKVFIIYGRNEKAYDAMRDFLRALGLTPSDFQKLVTSKGTAPFIGQVIDESMREAQAMVAIFTPDEHARLLSPKEWDKGDDRERYQARPNVIFEAGMAMGVDEKRTIIVTLGNVSLFSDLHGRHVVRMSNTVTARDNLKARLRTAGCAIDEDTDWSSKGDFDGAVAGLNLDPPKDSPAPAAPAVPSDMPDPTAKMKLVVWLQKNERTEVARGTPIELARIDSEAGVPAGTTERLIQAALEEPWSFLSCEGGFLRLEKGPERIRDVRGSDRFGRRR